MGGYSIPSPANGSTLDLTAPGSLYGSPPSGTSYFPQYGWLAIYTYLTPSSGHGTTTGLLDLIHWDNSGPGGQQMFWYSQEGGGSLADHWSPLSSFITTVLGSHWLISTTENASGLASYTPLNFDQPGWAVYYPSSGVASAPIASQYTFNFQSSVTPVPEPSHSDCRFVGAFARQASTLQILRKKRKPNIHATRHFHFCLFQIGPVFRTSPVPSTPGSINPCQLGEFRLIAFSNT